MFGRHLRGLDRRGSGGNIPFVQVHIGFFANQVRVTASDALDLGEGVHDLLLAVDIGVEKPKNELEVRLLSRDECCRVCKRVVAVYHNSKRSTASRSRISLEDLHMMFDALLFTLSMGWILRLRWNLP